MHYSKDSVAVVHSLQRLLGILCCEEQRSVTVKCVREYRSNISLNEAAELVEVVGLKSEKPTVEGTSVKI